MDVSPEVSQRVSNALTQFKQQMRANNLLYAKRCAEEVNKLLPAQRMKRFIRATRFAGTLPSTCQTPEQFIESPPPYSHIDHDGTWPAKSADEVSEFLRKLTEKINEHFDENDEEGELVVLPEEYRALLAECDGVWDVEFRRSEACGINGTNCLDPLGIYFVGKNEKFTRIDKWEEQSMGWEIATGWGLDGNEFVTHYYFYCQRTSEGQGGPIQDSERGWDWRLFYRDTRSRGVGFLVFGGIPEFLEWFGNWYARDIEGDTGEDGLMPEALVQDPPYEEGADNDDEEEEEEIDDDEDAEALAMQEVYLAEAARREG